MLRRGNMLAVLIGLSAGLAMSAQAVAPDFLDKLAADARPAEDKGRDGSRRPYQVMQLLDVQAGMTVVDVAAGGGWYTEVLSAAVGPSGTVIADFGPRGNMQERQARADRLGNVEAIFEGLAAAGTGVADRAVTALSLHHRNAAFLREIYEVLKPGGMAVVIDHEGSPGMDNDELHRMLKADAQSWIEEAGFEIIEDSDLLHTSADDHSMYIMAPELGRDTDRFLFLVRRP
ncbi:MAG: class I SAM-dependent methyltransferase [Gammaproteobacteria bacterium]|nr:class I SAM-dependent methyltransferase [Gammaproteobacteria bacterium]